MSDLRVRELERRFRETGAQLDEAAWLGERLRVGQLEPQALEIAARLGHGTAGLILATRPAPARELIGLVASAGLLACARAAHALAAATVERLRVQPPSAVRALAALERWLEEGAVGSVRPEAFALEGPSASLGKRVRKRVAWTLATVRHACQIPALGVRIARVALEATWREAERLLPAREPARVVAATVGRWLLSGERPGAPQEPALLLVVTRRVVQGGEVLVQPGLDLANTGELRFQVEVRPRGRDTGPRCLARAVPRHGGEWRHTLFLPLEKSAVPVGSGVWEVGP